MGAEDDFERYIELRRRGPDAGGVYRQPRADGLDLITSIRMLRRVFDIGVVAAKEVILIAEGGESIVEHQERLRPALEAALSEVDENP
jgi:hypothetical protein